MESKALDGRQLMAEWVLEHFDHPFPLPEEKDMLSRLTGLPRAQVFITAFFKHIVAMGISQQICRTIPICVHTLLSMECHIIRRCTSFDFIAELVKMLSILCRCPTGL